MKYAKLILTYTDPSDALGFEVRYQLEYYIFMDCYLF